MNFIVLKKNERKRTRQSRTFPTLFFTVNQQMPIRKSIQAHTLLLKGKRGYLYVIWLYKFLLLFCPISSLSCSLCIWRRWMVRTLHCFTNTSAHLWRLVVLYNLLLREQMLVQTLHKLFFMLAVLMLNVDICTLLICAEGTKTPAGVRSR